MTVLFPKVTYYRKPHTRTRWRQRDENGVSMWRKFRWKGKSQEVVIKEDKISPDINVTCQFLIFYP